MSLFPTRFDSSLAKEIGADWMHIGAVALLR